MVRAGLGLQDLQEFEVSKLVWGAGLRGSSPKLPRSFISTPPPAKPPARLSQTAAIAEIEILQNPNPRVSGRPGYIYSRIQKVGNPIASILKSNK